MPDDQDLVTVARFPSHHEAHLAAGYLEANGLDAVVGGSPLGVSYNIWNGEVVGEYRLQVRRGDAAAAFELLASPEPLDEDFEP